MTGWDSKVWSATSLVWQRVQSSQQILLWDTLRLLPGNSSAVRNINIFIATLRITITQAHLNGRCDGSKLRWLLSLGATRCLACCWCLCLFVLVKVRTSLLGAHSLRWKRKKESSTDIHTTNQPRGSFTSHSYLPQPPPWSSGKGPQGPPQDRQSWVRFSLSPRIFFSGSSHISYLKIWYALNWLPWVAPEVIGSKLRLVDPVSVYCDWVR